MNRWVMLKLPLLINALANERDACHMVRGGAAVKSLPHYKKGRETDPIRRRLLILLILCLMLVDKSI